MDALCTGRSILKQLDPIHHQGLGIALGAFRTSPAQSLYIEAHEPTLTTRRLKLSLNYVLKLKSLPENPAYSVVFEPENTKLFEASESKSSWHSHSPPPGEIQTQPKSGRRWTSSLGNFPFL